MNRLPPAHPRHSATPPAWYEFLAYVERQAQRARFAADPPAWQDTWADTQPAQPAQLDGLEVTEHEDDAVTREVFALLGRPAAKPCPPCNGDCLQGDECTALDVQQRRAERARLEAQSIEARHPWLWLVYAGVAGLTLWLCTVWPWGFALPGVGR